MNLDEKRMDARQIINLLYQAIRKEEFELEAALPGLDGEHAREMVKAFRAAEQLLQKPSRKFPMKYMGWDIYKATGKALGCMKSAHHKIGFVCKRVGQEDIIVAPSAYDNASVKAAKRTIELHNKIIEKYGTVQAMHAQRA